MNHTPSKEVLDVLESQLLKLERSINAQAISNILWAYGTLGICSSECFLQMLVNRANLFSDKMNSTEQAMMITSIEKLESSLKNIYNRR